MISFFQRVPGALKRRVALFALQFPGPVKWLLTLGTRIAPHNPWLAAWHGRWELHFNRYEQALACTALAMEHAANNIALLVVRANALYKLKRFGAAEQQWHHIIECDPQAPEHWIGLCRTLHNTDRRGEIDGLIDRYQAINSGSLNRYLDASSIAAALWRPSFKILAAKAYDECKDDPESLLRIGAHYHRIGHIGEAQAMLVEARERSGNDTLGMPLQQLLAPVFDLIGIDTKSTNVNTWRGSRLPECVFDTLLTAPVAPDHARAGVVMLATTLGPGGAERQVVNTVAALRENGFDEPLHIVQLRDEIKRVDDFFHDRLDSIGVRVQTLSGSVALDMFEVSVPPHITLAMSLLPAGFQLEVARICRALMTLKPRVLHCWNDHRSLSGGFAAALCGTPCVLLSTRSVAPPGTRVVPDYFKPAYQALLRHQQMVLVNNSRAGAQTYDDWLELEYGHTGVIHNGIDVEGLDRAASSSGAAEHIRSELGLTPSDKLVGSLFRISSEKRPELWLQVVREIADRRGDVKFVILGEGPLRADMEDKARELGISDRVRFVGLIREVGPWLRAMQAVLLTSSREGTSNTALEAQSLGIPVVSPAVGGMSDVLLDGVSGFLVAENPTACEIADRLEICLDDAEWSSKAGICARQHIDSEFSISAMARTTMRFYNLGRTEAVRVAAAQSIDLSKPYDVVLP